ncbi:MAG: alpha-L-fucosidase [Phycisphaerae bacterium]|nr:alpha-L-fucosidase [Phycisphaerae bacterium]
MSVNKTMMALGLVVVAATFAISATESYIPDFHVRPDDYTVLMAVDAVLSPGLKPFQAGAHGKFHVTGWTQPEQSLTWEVTVPQQDNYAVNVLLCQNDNQPLTLAVSGTGQTFTANLPTTLRGWNRLLLDGTLQLPAGKQRLVLEAQAPVKTTHFNLSILSIELVRPAVRDRLHTAAMKLRADTRWFQACRYGLMCHWTTESFPRRGERKPYAQAVQDFDVEEFADQVQASGAGFLVFTTSHAEHFFPAPLDSLDHILLGRTTRRDLIAELADALDNRGIRLFLYYHLGAISDPAWLKATGFWETDTRRFFDNWAALISEAGRRYGDRLAGWWFDDGTVSYYYRSAPWERLTTSAKAGYSGRLVGFNSWELPCPTEFQDFFCGEGFADPGVGGLLVVGGDGHFKSGSHQGLQACATLITESGWVHTRKNTDIGPPRWNTVQMVEMLEQFIARKNVPIFNLEIYQEGKLSLATIELFKQAHEKLALKGLAGSKSDLRR